MDEPPQQLDLFAHSRDVMLRNDALHALQQRSAALAERSRAALAAEVPGDALLPALARLARELERAETSPLPDHDALASEHRALCGELEDAARRVFGASEAAAWLRPLWRALALRSASLPFVAAHAEQHAAPLWLCAEDWSAAAEAVRRIPSWRRIPAPLAWMLEARCRSDGLDACWPLLAELAWLAPRRLAGLLPRLGDVRLTRLQRQFEAEFEDQGDAADLAWLPAWLATVQPELAPRLAPAEPGLHSPAESGLRLVIELLGLERQGRHHDIVQRRRALRDLHAGLFAAYMALR